MLHYLPSITAFEEEINATATTNSMATLSISNNTENVTTAAAISTVIQFNDFFLLLKNWTKFSLLKRIILTIVHFPKDGNKGMTKMDAFIISITQQDERHGLDQQRVLGLSKP